MKVDRAVHTKDIITTMNRIEGNNMITGLFWADLVRPKRQIK